MNNNLDSIIGTPPPHDLDVEKSILGSVISDKYAIEDVITIVKSQDDFYFEKHKVIYQCILEMYKQSIPIDLLTVVSELRKKGKLDDCGGPSYITEITNNKELFNLDQYCKILCEYSLGRKLMALSGNIHQLIKSKPDYLEALEKVSKELYSIEGAFYQKEPKTIKSLAKDVTDEIVKAGQNKNSITGKRCGIEAIDNYTKGFGQQDLIIIAARPGMGKSSLVHTMMRNLSVDFNEPVALFSLEMSDKQVTKVLISHQTGVDHDLLKSGKLSEDDWDKYHKRLNPLLTSNVYIDDTPAVTLSEIKAKSRRLVAKHGVTMIIVDYLQLASGDSVGKGRTSNREQEISEISRGLKALAKELNVPVIALSQLSRAAESRSNKIPILSDLRDSGSIEQDADMVLFLFRPAYYGITEDEAGNKISKHLTKVIFAKFRDGDTGEVDLRFIGRMKMFDSMPGYEDHYKHEMPLNNSGFKSMKIDDFEDEDHPFD